VSKLVEESIWKWCSYNVNQGKDIFVEEKSGIHSATHYNGLPHLD